MWVIESDTESLLREFFKSSLVTVPPPTLKFGATEVKWWEGRAGDAIIMASGGSIEDRWLGEQIVRAQLEAIGYKRASFTFDTNHRTAGWPDIMAKAKRLIQGGNVTILRNGYNNVVGHVVGDHGEYNTEIGRDDPNSRTITTWTCECPWDQYAWQRTRKWKKYEGRPCAHVMATYWKALATPLDEGDPNQPIDPGQKGGPPPVPNAAPIPNTDQRSFGPDEAEGTSVPPTLPPEGAPPMAPPGEPGVLPPSPMEQLQMQQPPIPGATPAGMPANPAIVSVPGAKMPSPFNPIQYPGGTYSSAEEFVAPEIIRLKKDAYGMAEGKSEAHGAGQYQNVPANSTGEVLGQDPSTGWIEVIFPLEGGPLTPYHVRCFVNPSDLMHTQQQPPGPFIKRKR